MAGMLLISVHILDPFWKLRSFRKWDKRMDINPEDEISYATQYQEAFLKWVENDYHAIHRLLPVIQPGSVLSTNPVSSAMPSVSGQSSYDWYDLSSEDEDYLMPKNVARMTPWRSDRTACLLTTAWLYFNWLPELPQNWGQIDPNDNDYHSDAFNISSPFCIPDITEWWGQQEETHSKSTNVSAVAHNIFSILSHCVGVEARLSLGWDVVGWRQSNPTVQRLCETVIIRQFARDNNGFLAGDNPALDSTNTASDFEMKGEAEQKKLHRMAKVHHFLEMWQGSQNLGAIQKQSHTQNKQITAVGHISDAAEMVKAS